MNNSKAIQVAKEMPTAESKDKLKRTKMSDILKPGTTNRLVHKNLEDLIDDEYFSIRPDEFSTVDTLEGMFDV